MLYLFFLCRWIFQILGLPLAQVLAQHDILPNVLCVQLDAHGQFLTITCGNIEGKFYIAKFKKGIPSSKCVIHNSVWCSLVEFENYGGKSKSKNWK